MLAVSLFTPFLIFVCAIVVGFIFKAIVDLVIDGSISILDGLFLGLAILSFFVGIIVFSGKPLSYVLFLGLVTMTIVLPIARRRMAKSILKRMLEEDIEKYQKAIHHDPKNIAAHSFLGDAYMKQGKIDDAIREYGIAVEFSHSDTAERRKLERALAAKERIKLTDIDSGFIFCPICAAPNPKENDTCTECGEELLTVKDVRVWFRKGVRRWLILTGLIMLGILMIGALLRTGGLYIIPILYIIVLALVIVYLFFRAP